MLLLLYNIDILYNFIFISRGYAGSRRVIPEPTASQLMTDMSQYRTLMVRSWYSKFFSSSPMLCSYPTIYYASSARYLAFCAESITRMQLVMRRPLPILGTIVANRYLSGIFHHIKRTFPLHRRTLPPFIDRSSIGQLFLNNPLFNPLSLPLPLFLSTHFLSSLAISSILLPMLMGHLLWWDASYMGVVFTDLIARVNADLRSAISDLHGMSYICLETGLISTPVEQSEVVGTLVRTIETSREELHNHMAATMPTAHSPSKRALWLAGILLVVVLAHGGVIDEPCLAPSI